jgi:hypothetical protein
MPRIATAVVTPRRAKNGLPRQGSPAGAITTVQIGRKPFMGLALVLSLR